MSVGLEMIGNWDKEIGIGLRDVLRVSTEVIGESGEKACKRAIWYMAEAAGKLATKSRRKTRPVQRDEYDQYVDVYVQGHNGPYKVYKWMFDGRGRGSDIPGTWDNAKTIGNKGLGQRSWMWNLAKLNTKAGKKRSKAIPGMSSVYAINRGEVHGYIKANRLKWIRDAMGPGWESIVERSAGRRIMKNAVRTLTNKWRRRVGAAKGAVISNKDLANYFKAEGL